MHSEGELSAMASEGARVGGHTWHFLPLRRRCHVALAINWNSNAHRLAGRCEYDMRQTHQWLLPEFLGAFTFYSIFLRTAPIPDPSEERKVSGTVRTRPEKKALNHLPRHQGELNGREKCKYGGGAGEVVGKGGVGLLVVFHLGLEGLEEEHPGMEVVLPVAASPPLPSRERGRFHWHHMHTCHCHGFNNSHLFPLFGSMLDSIIESV